MRPRATTPARTIGLAKKGNRLLIGRPPPASLLHATRLRSSLRIYGFGKKRAPHRPGGPPSFLGDEFTREGRSLPP